jgi:type VI secretion system secreted protein VgrG
MRFSFNRLHLNHTFGRGTENKTRSKMFRKKNILNRMMSSSPLAGMGFAALLLVSAPALAQVAPNLLSAGSYSILAGSQVTNTGATTTVSGDVGISPGAGAVGANHPGLTAAMVGGTIHDKDGPAASAQFDQAAAYTWLDLNNACTVSYPGAFKELAGLSLPPGVYCATEFRLSGGTLTLSGNPSNTWVFKSASDLIISGGAAAKVVNPSCSVWWRVVSTATFDAGSSLAGNILADTSITLAAHASLRGKAFARTAEVTLSSNAISACSLAATPIPTPTPTPIATPIPTPGGPTPTPTPGGPTPTPTPGGPTPTPTPGGPTPTPTPPNLAGIPTLSGWGLMTLMVLIGVASIYRLRRI